jgi:Lrp/AsnC family transcriptional regulator, leucine-responsive regulatory protein
MARSLPDSSSGGLNIYASIQGELRYLQYKIQIKCRLTAKMAQVAQDSTTSALDPFDRAILPALVADARVSIADLAPRVGLSSTACARRLRALEERGVITGYHAALDHKKLGFAVTVLVRISLDSQREEAFEAFERAVAQCASVIRCHLMSGNDDYQLVVLCRDITDFEHIHKTQLARLPRVARIQSSFALRNVIDRGLPAALLAPISGKRSRRA